jgi:arylsulfate sulfotransferase
MGIASLRSTFALTIAAMLLAAVPIRSDAAPPATKADPAPKSATTLITGYYQSILGRAPDAGGLAYWEGQAALVQSLGANVNETWRGLAITFFNSPEYRSFNRTDDSYVNDLYRTFFARAPDAGGLAYWKGQLQGGIPREGILLWFLFSAEFDSYMKGLFGETTARAEADMVVDFYRGFLGRLPDEGGYNYWVARFRAAQCQGAAAVVAEVDVISQLFMASPDYSSRGRSTAEFLADLYNTFLRRGPDTGGWSYWLDRFMNTQFFTRDAARRAFLASPEFQARVQAVVAQGCQTLADSAGLTAAVVDQSVSPFLATVELRGRNLQSISVVSYLVLPKPGSVSKPVQATFTHAYLASAGYATAQAPNYRMPVFGLYAGYANIVAVKVRFLDGSVAALNVPVTAEVFDDPTDVYDRPLFRLRRGPGANLGFDFFYVKSELTMPVVIDTDGEVRWWVPGSRYSVATVFDRNGFVSSPEAMAFRRTELDGRSTETTIAAPYFRTHHNIDPGRTGVLVEVDDLVNGVVDWEHILVEVAADGSRIQEWKLGDLIGRHMAAHGDDPSKFVRFGTDWFHMNAAAYDPRDDSVIVSSRENFVIKVDYATGEIIWILGDPTKYWYTFPSLRAKALDLFAPGLYPIGQHAVSVTPEGYLLLFNNGEASGGNPPGTAKGENRLYSVVSAYQIDPIARTAREVKRFDYGNSIHSRFCSSVYEAGGSWLVSYSRASGGAAARLVGVDSLQRPVFDFEYVNPGGCNTSFAAAPIAFDNLVFP